MHSKRYLRTFYGTKPNVIISPAKQLLVWNIKWRCWDECPPSLTHLAKPYGGQVAEQTSEVK